jgi:lipoic acid synthetase
MILGNICTRTCRFCGVSSGLHGQDIRPDEGEAIAQGARELGLTYLVLTSVDRDDLPDRGAGHFGACVKAVKQGIPGIVAEVLVPDYTEPELALFAESMPEVLAHNLETVRSLQGVRDRRASFDKSLATLKAAKALGVKATKSSLLLGFGEKKEELLTAMDELREADVDILVIGQYLQPSKRQIPVTEYVSPEQFEDYFQAGIRRGFGAVIAAPFARTSYHAFEAFNEWKKKAGMIQIEGLGKPEGCKLIRLKAVIEKGLITAIQIWGDFFASPEEEFDRIASRLTGLVPEEIADRFDRLVQEAGIEVFGISGTGVASVLQDALKTSKERL